MTGVKRIFIESPEWGCLRSTLETFTLNKMLQVELSFFCVQQISMPNRLTLGTEGSV